MKSVIIVQARMTSTRLPGKVLKEVHGRPLLAWQIDRLKQCRTADEIILATTTNQTDEPIVDLARRLGVRWFRGSELDVLSRYVGEAREAWADVVVRVTSDCPLIDPEITDRVVNELLDHRSDCDYTANILRRTYPRGLDTEAFFGDTLFRLDRLSFSQPAREHVTVFVRERPDLFLVRSVEDSEDHSDLRWTVDTAEDLEVIRRIFDGLGPRIFEVPYRQILGYVRSRPEIACLNAGIQTWTPG